MAKGGEFDSTNTGFGVQGEPDQNVRAQWSEAVGRRVVNLDSAQAPDSELAEHGKLADTIILEPTAGGFIQVSGWRLPLGGKDEAQADGRGQMGYVVIPGNGDNLRGFVATGQEAMMGDAKVQMVEDIWALGNDPSQDEWPLVLTDRTNGSAEAAVSHDPLRSEGLLHDAINQ